MPNTTLKLPNPTWTDEDYMLDQTVLRRQSADFAYALDCQDCRRTLKKETLRETVRCTCGFVWREKHYSRLIPLMEMVSP